MICEYCLQDNSKTYGSGRFCSKKCASAFSTKAKRREINEAVSRKLTGRVSTAPTRTPEQLAKWSAVINTPEMKKRAGEALSRNSKIRILNAQFDALSPIQKRKRVILEQKNTCISCGLNEWLGKPITLELEHIDGNTRNNDRDNIKALCPNCHAQTPTWRKKKSALVVKSVKASALEAEEFVGSNPT